MKVTRKWAIAATLAGLVSLVALAMVYRSRAHMESPPPESSARLEIRGEVANPSQRPVTHPVSQLPAAKPSPLSQTQGQGAEPPGNADAEGRLDAYLKALENPESEVQGLQAERLREMRENPERYLPKLLDRFNALDEGRTYQKYKILFIVEQLNASAAIPFLRDVAILKASSVWVPNPGETEVLEKRQEVLMRMRAAGGLYGLARSGSMEARQALLDVITQAPDRSVRSDAIRGYLATSKDLSADRDYLMRVLPESDSHLVDTQPDGQASPQN